MSGEPGGDGGRPRRGEPRPEELGACTVLVAGDAMLDRYVSGDVERISPEAPVPVLRVRERRGRPGGAANVAAGVAALGADCRLAAAVGRDGPGGELRGLLADAGVDVRDVLAPAGRPTTVKTRVIGRDQQMLRLDREDRSPLDGADRRRLESAVGEALSAVDALAVADYGKGVLAGGTAGRLIRAAREEGVPVVVDPWPGRFEDYAGATVLKPNAREAAAASGGEPPTSDRELARLRRRLGVEHLLVTLGGEGMRLVDDDGAVRRIPARRVEVYDVTGAGDTVTAVLAAALPLSGDAAASARLANRAAAVEVQKLGARPVSRAELEEAGRRRA